MINVHPIKRQQMHDAELTLGCLEYRFEAGDIAWRSGKIF